MSHFITATSDVKTLLQALNSQFLREFLSTFSNQPDLEALKQTVETLNMMLLDADHKTELPCDAQDYIQKLIDALYDADDLVDKLVTQVELKEHPRDGDRFKKVPRLFSSKIAAWSVCQDVRNISKKLNVIAADGAKFGFENDAAKFGFGLNAVRRPPFRRSREPSSSHVCADDVIGREDDAKEIVGRLLNSTDDVGFLTIVGMGGLGKTTLAGLVFNHELIEFGFEVRLWVCVADHGESRLDVKQILSDILQLTSVGFKYVHGFPMEQVQHEYKRYFGGKKILFVLDDVWTENREEWLELRHFLMMGGKGSRIIATTRSNRTANIIGNDTHQLGGLSDANSWHLFKMMAFGESSMPHEFVDIGKNIVKRCSNVPLAIRVVGSSLYGQSLTKWHADELGFRKLDSQENQVMSVLMLSYNGLEPHLKSCFQYCALFPKDYVLKKEVLLTIWEAQGYIIPFESGQSIEHAAEEYLETLIHRGFFQDLTMNQNGDVESFKMHDLIHDIAQKVSWKGVRIINSSVPIADKSVRHLFDTTLIKEDDLFYHSEQDPFVSHV